MQDETFNRRKKMLTELIYDKAYVPMKAKEIAMLLDIPKSRRGELEDVLSALVAEGKIGISKKGKYGKPETFSLTGIFSGNARGFGFVTVEDRAQDVFIPEEKTGGALHGDRVQIYIEREAGARGRAEGAVLRILDHANKEVVGYYQKNKTYGFVIPDNRRITRDIFIPQNCDGGAVTGHKVVVQLTDFGDTRRNPEGRVTEILGHVNDPGTDILSLVRAYGLPEQFPPEVMEEAAVAPEKIEVPENAEERKETPGREPAQHAASDRAGEQDCLSGIGAGGVAYGLEDLKAPVDWSGDLAGRLDLRFLPTVTIDGEDAKDLDDAVTLGRNCRGNYILGVHIADVSHYVREGSALDQEALRRGTSVYLTDRVIPMLPHKLSNGICSLNAGENRLALSCIMEVEPDGTVADHRIAESVIRVDRRMTYTAVNAILTGGNAADGKRTEEAFAGAEGPADLCPEAKEYREFVPMFFAMKELADILRTRRRKRGAIDFDFPESKILLDEDGKPLAIEPRQRNAATRLIEDFMLLANETVAEDYYWQALPFLYRTHDKPDPDKMKELGIFINNFGYAIRMQQGEIHPKELQKLLDKLEGTSEEPLLSRLVLRSMKQARYTTDCSGHFGLAARYYTHFTSPIRRYPDLQIHRIIKENLRGGLSEKRRAHYEALLPQAALQSSILERRAEEAERETEKLKKCQYMSRFIGEEFTGVISGITNWGFYVELPNTVEGLVRMSDLADDYYIFDEKNYELTGERTGRTYKLGQSVRVAVSGTDPLLRSVDFVLAEEPDACGIPEEGGEPTGGKAPASSGSRKER